MTITLLSRASHKDRLSPIIFSLTRSILDPYSLISPTNPKTPDTIYPIDPRPSQTQNGSPNFRWIGYRESPRERYDYCYRNLLIARMSTFSDMAKPTNNDGKAESDLKKSTIQKLSWIDQYLPISARPYAHLARLDKPIGVWLLAWPCVW